MANIDERPLFHNFVRIKDSIWFWDTIHNGLFYSEEDGMANRVLLECYERYDLEKGSLYGRIALYDTKIIAAPYFAKEILIYDIVTQEEKYINLDFVNWSTRGGDFLGIVIKEQYAYVLGFYTSYVLKVNVVDAVVEKYMDLYSEQVKQEEMPYYKLAVLYNDKIVVSVCLEGAVFILDTESLNYEVEYFDEIKNYGFADIVLKDDVFWLMPARDDAVVKWDIKKRTKKYIYDFPEGYFYENKPGIGFVYMCEDDIYMIPLVPDDVLVFDTKTEKIRVESEIKTTMDEVFEKGSGLKKYYFIAEDQGKIVFLNGKNRLLYIYDNLNKKLSYREIAYSQNEDKWWANMKFMKIFGKKTIIENKTVNLGKYLSMLEKI